jgi:putative ABC transport system permease protein
MALPIAYPLRNLAARPGRTLLTGGVVALVVVACTLFLGLISSLKRTLVASGDPMNLVVLRKGSTNDGASQIDLDAYRSIRYLEGIAPDATGRPLISPELVVQPFFRTLDGGRENVLVRGVEPIALDVHRGVRIVQGRMIRPSSGEAVVGRAVRGRYEGALLGDTLLFGNGRWKVVGVLEADGASFESEVWVDVRELARDARRPYPYSGIRLRAASEADLVRLADRIAADPRYALEAQREIDYYEAQSESANVLYYFVVGIAILAGLGAGFGASNTLYAAVRSRTREIGTLRALGFSRGAILLAFETEAVVLALGGFALGALLSLLATAALQAWLGGVAFGSTTFTTNVVTLRVSSGDLLAVLGLASAIGLLGGLGPAWRAARMRPIEALRRA